MSPCWPSGREVGLEEFHADPVGPAGVEGDGLPVDRDVRLRDSPQVSQDVAEQLVRTGLGDVPGEEGGQGLPAVGRPLRARYARRASEARRRRPGAARPRWPGGPSRQRCSSPFLFCSPSRHSRGPPPAIQGHANEIVNLLSTAPLNRPLCVEPRGGRRVRGSAGRGLGDPAGRPARPHRRRSRVRPPPALISSPGQRPRGPAWVRRCPACAPGAAPGRTSRWWRSRPRSPGCRRRTAGPGRPRGD